MDHQFRGKVALITRAGQGLGRVITTALAKAGATVHAIARSKNDLEYLRKELPDVVTHEIDISSWDKTRALINRIGTVDLLVNNSGIQILKPFLDTTKEDFARIFSTNVAAVYNVSQVVAKSMVESGRGGAIVNVSSCAGARAFPRETAYCSSKAAVDMMTRAMAIELGKHKIRVNSVDPTLKSDQHLPMPPPRIKHNLRMGRSATLPARGKKGAMPVTIGQLKTGTLLPSVKEMILPPPRKFRPSKRKGVPRGVFKNESDVIYAIMFLLSEDAGFITGTMLPVESSSTIRG